MAGAWTTLSVKDAAGATRTMRAWDESGSGAGPFSFGQMLTDGSGAAGLALGAGAGGATTLRVTLDSGQVSSIGQNAKASSTSVIFASDIASTATTSVTRQANTTAYAANQAYSDSSSAPTAGGFTLTGAAGRSGGSGIISDLTVMCSNDPATPLQGEIWIFDQAVTAINDLAAFSISSADILNLVGVVPFTLLSGGAGTGGATKGSYANIQGLNLGFTCVGTANLRYLLKVKNAYTPASAEVLTVRAKIVQTN